MRPKCDICENRPTASRSGVCKECQGRLRHRHAWNRAEWDERYPMVSTDEETSSGQYHGDTDRDDI